VKALRGVKKTVTKGTPTQITAFEEEEEKPKEEKFEALYDITNVDLMF
jgi:hypothetical protein